MKVKRGMGRAMGRLSPTLPLPMRFKALASTPRAARKAPPPPRRVGPGHERARRELRGKLGRAESFEEDSGELAEHDDDIPRHPAGSARATSERAESFESVGQM